MPWYQEPMKDAISCDKPRGAANELRSGDFRMGKPAVVEPTATVSEYIGNGGQPGELKHLSTLRNRKQKRFPK